MNYTRRDFVKMGAVAGSYAAVPFWLKDAVADDAAAAVIRRTTSESLVPLVCPMCPAGCGLQARFVHGVPVGLSGNPEHPINCGTVCPRGLATLQSALHPARLDLPLMRDPDTNWRRVSTREDFYALEWNEAVQMLGARLRELRERGQAQRVAFIVDAGDNTTTALLKRFAKAYGSPNVFDWHWPFGEGPVDAMAAMLGSTDWTFDLLNANYVLSLGADWLQASHSPVEAKRALMRLNKGRAFDSARIVQVESRRSYTGEQADQWIVIRPGTEGAFALGVAAIIVRSGIMQRPFLMENTFGFEDWTDGNHKYHMGFKHYLTEEVDLELVAKTTGVDLATMSQIAYELAVEFSPAVALCDRLPLNDQMAVLALNALIGSVGVKGGMVVKGEVPLATFNYVPLDASARRSLTQTLGTKSFPSVMAAEQLPERVLDGSESPIDTLIFFGCNPLYSSAEPQRWATALKRVPFVVAFTDFLDATAEQATLVIPSANAFEGWQDAPRSTIDGIPVLGITPGRNEEQRAPDAGDIVLALAREIGGVMVDAMPWMSVAEVIRERVRPLFAMKEAQPFAEVESNTTQQGAAGFESFWRNVSRSGGWRAPQPEPQVPRRFPTPSRKIEFYAQALAIREEIAHLPHVEPPVFQGCKEEYPFNLLVYVPPAFYTASEEVPWLQLLADGDEFEMVAELHPSLAENLGIRDGDHVQVKTLAGSATMRARLTPHTHPDVVAVPLNRSHLGQGLWRRESLVNTATLVRAALDPRTGHPLWDRTRAQVTRVMVPNHWAAAEQ